MLPGRPSQLPSEIALLGVRRIIRQFDAYAGIPASDPHDYSCGATLPVCAHRRCKWSLSNIVILPVYILTLISFSILDATLLIAKLGKNVSLLCHLDVTFFER